MASRKTSAKNKRKKSPASQAEGVANQQKQPTVSQPKGSAFLAVLLISLGGILLLQNLGYLPARIWGDLWRFWPLLLVLAGLQAVFGRNWFSNLLITLIGLAAVALIVVASVATIDQHLDRLLALRLPTWLQRQALFRDPGERLSQDFSVSPADFKGKKIEARSLEFDVGSARIEIRDRETNDLLALNADYYQNIGQPELHQELDDSTVKLKLTTKTNRSFQFGAPKDIRYFAFLGQPDLATDLKLKLGAGKATIELNQLIVNNLNIDLGAGSIELFLNQTSTPQEETSIKVGAGAVTLNFDQQIGLKIYHRINAGSLRVDGTAIQGDGSFTSANFRSAPNKLQLSVEVGAGSVIIQTAQNI